jgi:moderate conductance mechanosensitive channel
LPRAPSTSSPWSGHDRRQRRRPAFREGSSLIAPLTDISAWLRGSGLEILLLVLGAVLAARFVTWSGRRITERIDAAATDGDALVRSEAAKHRHAVAQVLTWLSIALIWSVTAVQVLQRLGVPVASLVAPAAVLGAALGFGAQQVVRDLIAGIFIIVERQYGFGDVVHISAVGFTEGATGTIEEVALRTTRLRTPNGEVVIVPNGQIVQVTNLSRDWARAVVDVPLPAEVDVMRASELLRKVGEEAFGDEKLRPLLLDPPTVMGVESFDVGQVNLRMVARTLPGRQFEVGRDLRVRVAVVFQREGIGTSAEAGTEPDGGVA